MRQARALASRASWNLADQIVSSGTNTVLSILVARALTVEGFGAFAIAFTVYTFLVGAGRALISQPLVVRYTSRAADEFGKAAVSATGSAMLLGLASGLVVGAVGVAVGGVVGMSLLWIGLLLPGLLVQDMWRAVFVAEGKPSKAFVNDCVWAVVQLGAVLAVIGLGRESAESMLVAWGGAALVAALVGGLQFRAHPRLRGSFGWLLRQRDLVGYYAATFFAVMGANQLTMLLIGALGEPADVGALRAAQVVLGPLNLLGYSISAFALAEIARRQTKGRTAIRVALAVSAIMVLADIVWGVILIALPESVGAALLGETWRNAQAVLPAALLGLVAIGAGLGASVLMIARGYAKESFWTQSILAPGFLVLGLLGLELGGAPGAALGLSLAQCIVTPVAWWRVVTLMRREQARSAAGAEQPDDLSIGRSTGLPTA